MYTECAEVFLRKKTATDEGVAWAALARAHRGQALRAEEALGRQHLAREHARWTARCGAARAEDAARACLRASGSLQRAELVGRALVEREAQRTWEEVRPRAPWYVEACEAARRRALAAAAELHLGVAFLRFCQTTQRAAAIAVLRAEQSEIMQRCRYTLQATREREALWREWRGQRPAPERGHGAARGPAPEGAAAAGGGSTRPSAPVAPPAEQGPVHGPGAGARLGSGAAPDAECEAVDRKARPGTAEGPGLPAHEGPAAPPDAAPAAPPAPGAALESLRPPELRIRQSLVEAEARLRARLSVEAAEGAARAAVRAAHREALQPLLLLHAKLDGRAALGREEPRARLRALAELQAACRAAIAAEEESSLVMLRVWGDRRAGPRPLGRLPQAEQRGAAAAGPAAGLPRLRPGGPRGGGGRPRALPRLAMGRGAGDRPRAPAAVGGRGPPLARAAAAPPAERAPAHGPGARAGPGCGAVDGEAGPGAAERPGLPDPEGRGRSPAPGGAALLRLEQREAAARQAIAAEHRAAVRAPAVALAARAEQLLRCAIEERQAAGFHRVCLLSYVGEEEHVRRRSLEYLHRQGLAGMRYAEENAWSAANVRVIERAWMASRRFRRLRERRGAPADRTPERGGRGGAGRRAERRRPAAAAADPRRRRGGAGPRGPRAAPERRRGRRGAGPGPGRARRPRPPPRRPWPGRRPPAGPGRPSQAPVPTHPQPPRRRPRPPAQGRGPAGRRPRPPRSPLPRPRREPQPGPPHAPPRARDPRPPPPREPEPGRPCAGSPPPSRTSAATSPRTAGRAGSSRRRRRTRPPPSRSRCPAARPGAAAPTPCARRPRSCWPPRPATESRARQWSTPEEAATRNVAPPAKPALTSSSSIRSPNRPRTRDPSPDHDADLQAAPALQRDPDGTTGSDSLDGIVPKAQVHQGRGCGGVAWGQGGSWDGAVHVEGPVDGRRPICPVPQSWR